VFSRILLPLDGSHVAECVLPHAIAFSRAFGAPITLLHVLAGEERAAGGNIDPLSWHLRKVEAHSYLADVQRRLDSAGLQAGTAIVEGSAAERILAFAHENDNDLILLSSHGRSGLTRWNISSVVQKIILQGEVSTMIVRAYQAPSADPGGLAYRRVLVPLDRSPRAECALPAANALARAHDACLLLAHVVCRPDPGGCLPLGEEERALLDRVTARSREAGEGYLQQVCGWLTAPVETRVLEGCSPAVPLHELVDEEHVDVVVLSAHGQGGEPRWPYGSVALSFIAYGTTPLLVVQDMPAETLERSEAEVATIEKQGH
jgi:nucleotide-binding universal stress UspA family protein